jgi:hypothetical protein
MKLDQDRRLPRPIGGERNYNKGSGGGGIGSGMPPYNTLDGLDCGQAIAPGGSGNAGPGMNSWAGPSPVGGLVGMYGAATPPATSQPQMHGGGMGGGGHGPLSGPPQGPPRVGDRGGNNVYNNRRLMEDMDAGRMYELQQQVKFVIQMG